jgi:hypothetical protein
MTTNPLGIALSMLNRFAGSETVDRLGLRQPAEKLAFHAARGGLRAAEVATRQFTAAVNLVAPARLPRPQQPPRFDLTPSEDQQMFRDSARRFATDRLRPAGADADHAQQAPETLLAELAELGLVLLAIPEALGGAGSERSPLTSVLVAEDLAYGDMGLAVAGMAPLGVVNALVEWGSAEQQARYLPAFVEDPLLAASVAITEPRPLFDPAQMTTRAETTADGFILRGTKSLVPLAAQAELLLVAAELDTKGPHLFLVRRGLPGLTATAVPSMGVRAAGLGTVEFDDVQLERSDLLGETVGTEAFDQIVDLARIAWCAMAVGTSQAVLDYVITYCNERIAFGEPVSHRQSVAFTIADIAIELDAMRLLTHRAASRAEHGLPFHREAYLAHVFTTEKGMQIGTDGVQMLGGHGFVKEHPVERRYRDLRGVGIVEGGLVA